MKETSKNQQAAAGVRKPEQITPPKQTSGDKSFDDAIDRILKKPSYQAPVKS